MSRVDVDPSLRGRPDNASRRRFIRNMALGAAGIAVTGVSFRVNMIGADERSQAKEQVRAIQNEQLTAQKNIKEFYLEAQKIVDNGQPSMKDLFTAPDVQKAFNTLDPKFDYNISLEDADKYNGWGKTYLGIMGIIVGVGTLLWTSKLEANRHTLRLSQSRGKRGSEL